MFPNGCTRQLPIGASHCPWGVPKIMPIGPSAAAGQVATHGRKEGMKARKYIRITVNILDGPDRAHMHGPTEEPP